MANEIELRGHISAEKFTVLADLLHKQSQVKIQKRCFIDYSTFLGGLDRSLDVRCRITNGNPEIVVKKGNFEASIREEAILPFDLKNIEHGLHVMHLLGYSKGVMGARRITKGTIGPVEVALQEVIDCRHPGQLHERIVEVEFKGKEASDEDAVKALHDFLQSHQLKAFSKEEWFGFIEQLNQTANGVYTHGETPISLIVELGS